MGSYDRKEQQVSALRIPAIYTEGDLIVARWRTGRKVGRTIYAQARDEPSDEDLLIGVMDSPRLAARLVQDHNRSISR
jgi:hypothetical protein